MLTVGVRGKGDVGALLDKMLRALGASFPRPSREKLDDKFDALSFLVEDTGVSLVILDETHHFMRENQTKFSQYYADTLKTFINETNVSVVLAGLPSIEQLLGRDSHRNIIDEQLERRFSRLIRLEPTKLDSDDWESLVGAAQSRILVPSIDLTTEEMLTRLHLATDGKVAYLSKLLARAIDVCDEVDGINTDALEHAHYLSRSKSYGPNPFSAEIKGLSRLVKSRDSLKSK